MKEPVTHTYKGYRGVAEWDDDSRRYSGYVLDIDHVITFVGRTEDDARRAMERSVDVYVDWCREDGEESERPRSPGLQHLHDRYIGDDPERVASYRAELARIRQVIASIRARRHTPEADAERERFIEEIRKEFPPASPEHVAGMAEERMRAREAREISDFLNSDEAREFREINGGLPTEDEDTGE